MAPLALKGLVYTGDRCCIAASSNCDLSSPVLGALAALSIGPISSRFYKHYVMSAVMMAPREQHHHQSRDSKTTIRSMTSRELHHPPLPCCPEVARLTRTRRSPVMLEAACLLLALSARSST